MSNLIRCKIEMTLGIIMVIYYFTFGEEVFESFLLSDGLLDRCKCALSVFCVARNFSWQALIMSGISHAMPGALHG